MNNNPNSFQDKSTILAVVLVAIVFLGWQAYLKNKYGAVTPAQQQTQAQTPEMAPVLPENGTQPTGEPTKETGKSATAAPTAATQPENLLPYENDKISFKLSSKGMALKDLTLRNHTDRAKNPMKLGESETHGLYELMVLNQAEPLHFEITQKSPNEFEGVAQFENTKIRRVMKIQPETEALENSVFVEGVDSKFPGLVVSIPEKAMEVSGGSFLMPSFEHQEFVVLHSGTEERFNSSASTEKIEKNFSNVSLLGIGSQYFASAIVDKSVVIPEARLLGGHEAKELLAQMTYKPISGQNSMELKWVSYSGGKSVSTLEIIDKDLSKIVDLGFFATIGRGLLRTLVWLHSIFGNWGVAIILLTLMVRIIVLPLNISTFRSTKKMQKLQPVIASLRERYKDDPQAMNREMMNVWKENKVNPLGGCLPMLLQLPIFFALYRVLGQSIELYQAPFIGWIHDLSVKDPWYVLPVLLAISMFIQQKITPTTMDPTQAKVMQFLPLIFALMMVSLPAGLTLYIFINTLSGIILQQIFMHDRKNAMTTKEAKA